MSSLAPVLRERGLKNGIGDPQPRKMGLIRGEVALEGEEPVSFAQFVYP